MAMSYVWVILLFVSVVFGALTGSAGAVGAAAVQGAESAVELTLTLAGPMIFYSALLEVMERSGLTEKALPRAAPGAGMAVPLVPERSGAGRGALLQHERKSARARQCRHACRHPRRAAAARALRRRGGVRRAVPSRRTQHRVHSAPPDDRRGAALGLRRGKRVRYSARGVDIVCGGRGRGLLAERLFRRAP